MGADMKKIYFIVLIFCAQNTYAAIATTYCNAKATYTSCNAGYYLSGGNCVACEKEHIKTALGQIHRVRIVRHWAVLQGLHRPLAQHQEHYVLYRLIHL